MRLSGRALSQFDAHVEVHPTMLNTLARITSSIDIFFVVVLAPLRRCSKGIKGII